MPFLHQPHFKNVLIKIISSSSSYKPEWNICWNIRVDFFTKTMLSKWIPKCWPITPNRNTFRSRIQFSKKIAPKQKGKLRKLLGKHPLPGSFPINLLPFKNQISMQFPKLRCAVSLEKTQVSIAPNRSAATSTPVRTIPSEFRHSTSSNFNWATKKTPLLLSIES